MMFRAAFNRSVKDNGKLFLWKRCLTVTSQCLFLNRSPNAALDTNILNRFKKLKLPKDCFQATYIWIDGTRENIRGKDRILRGRIEGPEDLPLWIYDGSSTYQACDKESDMILVPRTIYRDPFKPGKSDILVMCETSNPDGSPTIWNQRCQLKEACEAAKNHEPLFGIEQEYVLQGTDGRPYGWPHNGFPALQGPYYCSVGANRAYGRDIVEAHALACLYAGVAFNGTNAEVLPSQWEFQVGVADGLKAADDIWVGRYILKRIAELHGVEVNFDPKPVEGDWNGSGAHTNFSTKAMREDGGFLIMQEAIAKLEKKHAEHIKVYDPKGGEDNTRRLHGVLETSKIDTFTWGIGKRGVSVRIPRPVANSGKGFFEDRRPAANCDPYAVCNALIRTCILDD